MKVLATSPAGARGRWGARWGDRSVMLVAVALACWGLLDAAGLWRSTLAARVEHALDDWRASLFAPQSADPRTVIVDIDERSLAEVGRWPWGRDQIARLVTRLFDDGGVRAIGFDLAFPEPQRATSAALDAAAAADPVLAARLAAWLGALDADAQLAAALVGRPVTLGFYLTADRGAQQHGALPRPLFAWSGPTPGLPHWTGFGGNLPALAAAAPAGGFFNSLPDDDGLVRSVPLLARFGDDAYPSLALALALLSQPGSRVQPAGVAHSAPGGSAPAGTAAVALTALQWLAPPDTTAAAPVKVLRSFPLSRDGSVRVPFGGRGGPGHSRFTYLSAADVLAGRADASLLRGRLVLVGTSAPGQADLRPTPIHPALPGVEVHAHLLAGLLDGRLPARPDWAGAFQAASLLGVLAASAAVAARLTALPAALAFAALAAVALGGNLWAYQRHGLVLPLAVPLLAGAVLLAFALVQATVRERQRRLDLAQLFAQYVPPDVARALARDMARDRARSGAHDPAPNALQADNRELTVLFCDLRGFSGVAQQLTPQQLRTLINLYFSRMTAIVHAHGGTLDKFIGDAVMAFWGAPRADPAHALHAVQAALAMAQAVGPLNAALAQQGLPAVALGIGLATGTVCVGDLGSAMRRSYTAVGDAVNVAARVEALTRPYGVDLLVADSTRQACGDRAALHWVEVAQVPVRGRQGDVTLFTALPAASADTDPNHRAVATWHLALAAARGHDASELAARLAELAAEPDLAPRLRALLPLLASPGARPT